MAESATEKKRPLHFVLKNNENPNRLLAFPFVGLLIKLILLIPVFLIGIALSIAYVVLWMITPFVILYSGKYWQTAYNFNVGYFTYYTKITVYLYGLTDKYPGFNLQNNGSFELKYEQPTPVRWMAFPISGFFGRMILLLPYAVFESVLGYGAFVAVIGSWFAVLFRGKYPESLYEFERDGTRVSLEMMGYMTYMTDKYPSFFISMNHQTTKIVLIVLGALLFMLSNFTPPPSNNYNDTGNSMYDSTQNPTDTTYPNANGGS